MPTDILRRLERIEGRTTGTGLVEIRLSGALPGTHHAGSLDAQWTRADAEPVDDFRARVRLDARRRHCRAVVWIAR